MDLPLEGRYFTWSNAHAPQSMSRLDRFSEKMEWGEYFQKWLEIVELSRWKGFPSNLRICDLSRMGSRRE